MSAYATPSEKCSAKDPSRCRFHGNVNPVGRDSKITQILSLMSPNDARLREQARTILQIGIAEDTSSRDELEFLVENGNDEVRGYVARNPKTPIDLLAVLSEDKSPAVRGLVAGNKNVTMSLLEALSKDREPYVRFQVATNPKLSVEILDVLSKDSSPLVLDGVAGNSKASSVMLERVISNPRISANTYSSVISHKNATDYVLERGSSNVRSSVRKATAAVGRKLPESVFVKLVCDEDESVRFHLARREDLTREQALVLSRDSSEYVVKSLANNHKVDVGILEGIAARFTGFTRDEALGNIAVRKNSSS